MTISVRGCRVHNLKNVDVDVPAGRLIAVCGLSGSGKTSLALDTLYAEGQRCYIESFSAYTRQYLDRLDRPDVDSITGIPPAIAVTRAGGVRSNRSTVGTSTEIAEHMRLLFAKTASLVCHRCGRPVTADDPASVAAWIGGLAGDTRVMIAFEVFLPSKVEAAEILLGLQQEGYLRLVAGGETFHLSDEDRTRLAKKVRRGGVAIDVVVDRVSGGQDESRLTESVETAMAEGGGRCVVYRSVNPEIAPETDPTDNPPPMNVDGRPMQRQVFSRDRRCDRCDIDYPPPVPRLFNFNHPLGACPTCEGFGDVIDIDMDLVIPDKTKSIADGAIAVWNTPAYEHEKHELMRLAKSQKLPVDVPYKDLTAAQRRIIHDGVPSKRFGGLKGFFAWLDRKKYKMHVRVFASRFRSYRPCGTCGGRRLKPEALAYRVGDRDIAAWLSMRCQSVAEQLSQTDFGDKQSVASEPTEQVIRRIGFLQSVGLGYLQLDRPLRTLSGGEIQRVSLTSTLGSSLVNMLYVLDEPTAGLHPIDVDALAQTIVGLRDRGNTVIIVEHEETMLRLSDHVIEIGPAAGTRGGEIVFEGSTENLLGQTAESTATPTITAAYLTGQTTAADRPTRRPTGQIKLTGATGHNLQNVTAEFPTGVMCLVTGISGSGKSTLIQDTLFPSVASRVTDGVHKSLPVRSVSGLSGIDDCLSIDQSPISRSARSVPITYVKAFDAVRKTFAATVAARGRNLTPGHFSFNSDKGQCPQCEGAGVLEIDMQFLADVSIQCPSCRGRRYRDEILSVTYRDRSIADVLEMTADQAIAFFRGEDKVIAKLKPMIDVGLDYVRLGQSATTLSSGEGQRLKLAAFLASTRRRRTLFIMDEPTTGLHFDDIARLIHCFDALLDDGHSLIIVEHHPMLMAAADHIIDIGPGAADQGGRIVATGTPAEIAEHKTSLTGEVLRRRGVATAGSKRKSTKRKTSKRKTTKRAAK